MARVMFVDDSKALIDNLAELLQINGHEVITAYNGQEGLASLSLNPQIIFCDYNMPIMNGYEFILAIKRDTKYVSYRNIPIVGIGEFPDDKKEHLVESLTKPVHSLELRRCIDQYCQ
jgi:CheY-like chemotaxis protein